MNRPLLNTFWLEEVKRLHTMKVHSKAQLYVKRIVFSTKMICMMKVLFAIETNTFFTHRKAPVACTADTGEPTIQKNIRNLSHNYDAKMKNED